VASRVMRCRWLIVKGHESVVRVLVGNGTDVNAEGGFFGTPL